MNQIRQYGFLLILICIGLINSAIAQDGQYAEFSFDKKHHKFKPVKEGAILEHAFTFTNTGDVPLIITNYKVACACTQVRYPKEPVLPGKTGEIHVIFDTKGKIGWQYRTIKLYANVPKEIYEIELRVKVLKD